MKLISLSPFLSVLLTPVLVAVPLWAQTSAALPSPFADSPLVQGLQLRLVESDGPEAPAGSETVKGFTIEVKDSAGALVADAAVAFRLPDSGATGTFADGTHAAVSYTDSLGRAHMSGIRWSASPGLAALRVTAAKGTAHAGILVEESLIPKLSVAGPAVLSPLPGPPPETASPQVTVKTTSPSPQPGVLAHPSVIPLVPVSQQPAVSVTGGSPQAASHSGKTKWIIIAAIAVGAGLGAAMAMKGKSSTATPPPATGISIGAPTLSVGQ